MGGGLVIGKAGQYSFFEQSHWPRFKTVELNRPHHSFIFRLNMLESKRDYADLQADSGFMDHEVITNSPQGEDTIEAQTFFFIRLIHFVATGLC